jgi:hypothetical protein
MKELFYTLICTATAMIGYTIHNSLFWAIMDFCFMPIALIKWFICHEITLKVIQDTFSWFS